MQYAGLTLTERDGDYYFEDARLAATHDAKGPTPAKRADFMRRHGLKESQSSKAHSEWGKLLPSEFREKHTYRGRYFPVDEIREMDWMKQLHDHAELFTKGGKYVYTTQPYSVTLAKYQELESFWRGLGLYVDISIIDAWWYPGKTPLIVISQVPLQLHKMNAISADELLKMEFDPSQEKEYRRGYLDGFLAALDYVDEGKDIEWLYRFREQVLERWAIGDCHDVDEPPLPGSYLETDEGFIEL